LIQVKALLAEQQMTIRELATATDSRCYGSRIWKHAPGRAKLYRIATVLHDAELEMIATNDVFWDKVASVESLGQQEVYDATVLGTHNFIADGIAVHNSIEQDADMVVLLTRSSATTPAPVRPT
jgi:replicative DNA helicase